MMSKSVSLHMFAVFAAVLVALASIATSVLAVEGSGYGGDSVHCTIDANPGVVENGATTLIWWSSENVTSANLEGVGAVDPKGYWWTNGIESDTTYTLTVMTDDGQSATCETAATLTEESVEHGYCSEVYPGREIADIDGNGWGDTQHGETGCMIDPSGEEVESECYDWDGDGWGWDGEKGCLIDGSESEEEEEEETDEVTHNYCSVTYPGRVMVDANGDGWGDTESDEAGCMMDPEEVEEVTTDHGYCSDVYPGREIADIDGNGWGDTESGETGCKIATTTEEETDEVTHNYCSVTYPGRVMVDANGDGWGDTESDEAGCMMDPITEETEETSSHAYCSEVYPGRVIADVDGNGWGDTASGEEGCMIDSETEESTEEVSAGGPTCTVSASPSTIGVDGATTLSWTGSDDAVSSSLRPYGSTGVFFEGVDPSNEIYISGITDSRSYVVTVTDADGNTGECVVDLTVE